MRHVQAGMKFDCPVIYLSCSENVYYNQIAALVASKLPTTVKASSGEMMYEIFEMSVQSFQILGGD